MFGILVVNVSVHSTKEVDCYQSSRISAAVPTKAEVIKALIELKNGKAPKVNSLTLEILKADTSLTPEIFLELFKDMWEREEIPEDWKKGMLTTIL